ncbi:MAG: histidine phosphatase family protein [Betaproteobacteria bacterium]|nr:histidine phosphatase family protein [Betaproteobacteria bacterium]
MDLILWRHAEAEEHEDDLRRRLTAKGRKQAARAAEWLLQRLPARFALISSPAVRAHQTAQALGTPIKVEQSLAPGASPKAIIAAAGWPDYKGAVLIVGHQPDLGRALAQLVANAPGPWSVKKGAFWWISNRVRDGDAQVVVRAVVSPDLL